VVNLSLKHGNTDASCSAYVGLGGFIAGPRFGDYNAGFRFGRLGCDLVEQRGLQRNAARTYMVFGNIVVPWTQHVRAGRDLIRRAFDVAHAIGDLTCASYSCNSLIMNLLAAGDPLVDVQREAEAGLGVCRASPVWSRDRHHRRAAWAYPHPPRLDANLRLFQRRAVSMSARSNAV